MISIVTLTEGFPCCNDKKKIYTRGLEVGHYERLFDFVRNFIFLYLIMLSCPPFFKGVCFLLLFRK